VKTIVKVITLSTTLACLALSAQETKPARGGGLAERFKQLDRNGDGKISREEGGSLPFFEVADKDRDGFVTPDELRAYFLQQRGGASQTAPGPAKPKAPPAPQGPTAKPEMIETRDVRYATAAGVDANLQSLDIYAPMGAKNAPVVVGFHGGGWRGGDKRSFGRLAEVFTPSGYVFVSGNYRVAPAATHPALAEDVAAALAWVQDHIAEHGGDPKRIFVTGHSAGAHLASLAAVDERHMKKAGKDLSLLKGAILLDAAGYDLAAYLASPEATAGMTDMIHQTFGKTEAGWHDGSPNAHVAPEKNIPPFLIVFGGTQFGSATGAPALAEKLKAAGVPAEAVKFPKSHQDFALDLQKPDDSMTKLVMAFLAKHSGSKANATAASAKRPDFSGAWVVEQATSSESGIVYRVTQDETGITFQRDADGPVTRYSLDGSESVTVNGVGRKVRISGRWLDDGKTLELKTVQLAEDGSVAATILERQAFAQDGQSLALHRAVNGPRGKQEQTYTYRRASTQPTATTATTVSTTAWTPVSKHHLANLAFTADYLASVQPKDSPVAGGTEANAMEIHNGAIYCAVSHMPKAGGIAAMNAKILVKRSAASGWELDHATGSRFGRLGILKSVIFTTDGAGRKVNKPVPVLFCGTGEWKFQNPDSITILSRDDAKGRWVQTTISRDIWNPDQSNDTQEIRLIFDHVDRVTGVHYVFAGTTAGSLFHGVYDPAQLGLVRWEPKPDIDGCCGRFLGAAEANGIIYTSLAIDSRKDMQAAQNGAPIEKRCGIYRRVDGPNARWDWVRVKEWFGETGGDVSRIGYLCGLTAAPDPKNASRQVLLCVIHERGAARIEQLDLQQGHRATFYSDVSEQLDHAVGQRVAVSRMAYNDMTAVTDSASGRPLHLVSGWFKPAGNENSGELGKSAWYLVVEADGRAQLGRIFDPAHLLTEAAFGLRCSRSIRPSPFPEEKDRVWYFCGFHQTGKAWGNTAWIYKGTLKEKP